MDEKKNCTPIFEWCSPRNKLVLDYGKDILVLTGLRHNKTGNYVPHAEMVASAEIYGIPLTESYKGIITNLDDFMKEMQAKSGIEGFVIRFEDGTMYKVKTDWYFDRTKKDKQEFSLNSERNIWKYILDQEIDDALANANDSHLSDKVRAFEVLLYDTIAARAAEFAKIVQEYREKNVSKKSFNENIKTRKDIPKECLAILRQIFDNPEKEPQDLLIALVKRSCGNPQSLETARACLGGIKFYE